MEGSKSGEALACFIKQDVVSGEGNEGEQAFVECEAKGTVAERMMSQLKRDLVQQVTLLLADGDLMFCARVG